MHEEDIQTLPQQVAKHVLGNPQVQCMQHIDCHHKESESWSLEQRAGSDAILSHPPEKHLSVYQSFYLSVYLFLSIHLKTL